jgi:hypothetical protein
LAISVGGFSLRSLLVEWNGKKIIVKLDNLPTNSECEPTFRSAVV